MYVVMPVDHASIATLAFIDECDRDHTEVRRVVEIGEYSSRVPTGSQDQNAALGCHCRSHLNENAARKMFLRKKKEHGCQPADT